MVLFCLIFLLAVGLSVGLELVMSPFGTNNVRTACRLSDDESSPPTCEASPSSSSAVSPLQLWLTVSVIVLRKIWRKDRSVRKTTVTTEKEAGCDGKKYMKTITLIQRGTDSLFLPKANLINLGFSKKTTDIIQATLYQYLSPFEWQIHLLSWKREPILVNICLITTSGSEKKTKELAFLFTIIPLCCLVGMKIKYDGSYSQLAAIYNMINWWNCNVEMERELLYQVVFPALGSELWVPVFAFLVNFHVWYVAAMRTVSLITASVPTSSTNSDLLR